MTKTQGFTEVTVTDGHGEFMVHLDSNGEPLRMYTYADHLSTLPDRGYTLEEKRDPEIQLYDVRRYKAGQNPLFMHAKSKQFVKRMWETYLCKFASEEEMSQFS